MAGDGEFSSAALQAPSEAEAVEWLMDKGMTDGLPVIPPTPERVRAMLAGAGLQPGDVVGTVPERARVITAEKTAINAVMAGCKPEWLPVVVAALRAVCDPRYAIHGPSATTAGTAVLVIVNGPAARELGYKSGDNLLGPGVRANAATGRAVHLTLRNAAGARPEEFDRACFSHPGRYTYCIAENEAASPWEPFHVSRGFKAEESTVTVFAGQAPLQVHNDSGQTAEQVLRTVAARIAAPGAHRRDEDGEAVVLLGQEHGEVVRRDGWTRRDVQRFLRRTVFVTARQLEAAGLTAPEGAGADEPLHFFREPDSIYALMAGGRAGGWSVAIPGWVGRQSCRAVTLGILGWAEGSSCEIPGATDA